MQAAAALSGLQDRLSEVSFFLPQTLRDEGKTRKQTTALNTGN